MRQSKGVFFGIAFGLLTWMLAAASAVAADTLRVGMVPDAGATQVSVEQKAPLRRYLETKLGMPVALIIPTNYNATVEALGNGSLDVAYLGGLTYVKAHERYGAVPLVQRDMDRQFHSLFITHRRSGIASLSDLHGRTFCFGDINSTSGHLFPYRALKQAGISRDQDLKSYRHTGSHPATAQAVAAGVCDAGALDETVFRSMVADGKLSGDALKVFHTTEPFADYVWAARKDLPAGVREKLVKTFLELKPEQDGAVLEILRGTQYVPADDEQYERVRAIARELGLL